MTWRAHFAPIIRRVLEETRGLPEDERRLELWNHYPLEYTRGFTASYPHRIWMDEIRRQLGQKRKRKGLWGRSPAQRSLFEADAAPHRR